jgi:serine/threonine protein kinase
MNSAPPSSSVTNPAKFVSITFSANEVPLCRFTCVSSSFARLPTLFRYAHGRRVIHPALSPQSILVTGADTSQPQLKILNWQTGRFVTTTSQASSLTVQLEDWLEQASYVYLAPETVGARGIRDEVCDSFSLGAPLFISFPISRRRPRCMSYTPLSHANRS